jgi:hypothetical protein
MPFIMIVSRHAIAACKRRFDEVEQLSSTTKPRRFMSHYDHFEEGVQAGVASLVQCLVRDWQGLNPHEPELQANIAAWGKEFVEYVRKHVSVEKTGFATDSPYRSSELEIRLVIPRRPA